MGRGVRKRFHRVQSGYFHIILNTNYQNILFSDPLERYQFLRFLEKYLKKYNSKLYAFCLMHTHIHLLIWTGDLSVMMRCLLHDYSLWYNKRHGQKGSILRSPFTSHPKYSSESILETVLYILRNPYVDGLCSHPRHFFWSSYSFYFESKPRLSEFVTVDPSIVRNAFSSGAELYRVAAINPKQKELQAYEKYLQQNNRTHLTDEQVLLQAKSLAGNKPLDKLPQTDLNKLIIQLRNQPGASIRQISSVLHVSQYYVRRTLDSSPS
ncbi:MAG: transposase [Bacteroidales bacterium]